MPPRGYPGPGRDMPVSARLAKARVRSRPARRRGLLVKARIVRDEVLVGATLCADGVAESLVADLERLAGEARHV